MQQKLALAASLVADPEILLLNEPTLDLHVETSRLLREQIRGLAQKPPTGQEGKTIVLTTHQLPIAQKVCDGIAIMNRGGVGGPRFGGSAAEDLSRGKN